MLGMPPLCKRGTDCMNFGFVNFVRRPSVCAQPPGFDNNQPPGKVVRGKRCEMRGANIPITKFTEMEWNDGVFEGSKEHRRCSGKCTVFYLFLWILIILYAKIFLSYLCFQGSKVGEIHSLWSDVETDVGWDTRCEYFYHKVHEDGVKWWRFWGHWGISEMFWMCSEVVKLWSCEVVKLWSCEDVKMWFWNILLYEEILHYAVLRSEWQGYIFYWWLEICFNGRIVFESQRFFFLNCFFKWAKLAKFIRCEAAGKLMWDTRCELKGASISITKFTENRWNDCVFERTEEHRRCCGKCTSFSVYACRKEHILL